MQTIVNYIANALQARIPRIKIDTANDAATAHLTIPNKHGGKPINILAKAHAGIVVVFNKTPRLFDQDAKGIDKLAFDISEYLKGRSVYLDLLKSDGSDSGKDCIANSIEVQAENFTILTNLITRKGLLDSTELEKALQEGDIVRVNYWDPRKNYGYRLGRPPSGPIRPTCNAGPPGGRTGQGPHLPRTFHPDNPGIPGISGQTAASVLPSAQHPFRRILLHLLLLYFPAHMFPQLQGLLQLDRLPGKLAFTEKGLHLQLHPIGFLLLCS